MSDLKVNWQWPCACFLRYVGWTAIYSVLIFLPLEVLFYYLSNTALRFLCDIVRIIASVALEVLALKKVFFKKYKKFELEPKIDKVGWWLAIKVLIFSGIMAGIAATTVVVSYILSTCESVPALLGSLDEITRSAAVAGDADPQLLGAMLGESLDSLGVNLSSVFLVVIPASLLVALFISFLVLRHYIRKNATYKCQHASEIVH